MAEPNCLFCQIVAEEIPVHFVHQDELMVAFDDVNPQAPVHVLLVPRQHLPSTAALTEVDSALLGRLFGVGARIARDSGIAEGGYRTVANTGRNGGQTIDHLHFHLMGGRPFTWPPG